MLLKPKESLLPLPLPLLLPPMEAPPKPEFSAFVEVTFVELAPPTGVPVPPLDCMPAAEPRLAAKSSRVWPKKTWILVFCSPW